MRVLVTGDRKWSDREKIKAALLKLKTLLKSPDEQILVIQGGCRGADLIAKEVAEELGFETKTYPPDWARYGLGAGPIRNQQMIDEGKPDFALAFHDDLKHSKGTKDMVSRLEKANVPHTVIE